VPLTHFNQISSDSTRRIIGIILGRDRGATVDYRGAERHLHQTVDTIICEELLCITKGHHIQNLNLVVRVHVLFLF